MSTNNRKTTEQFIIEAKIIMGDRYDYSKVEYINNETNVCIICKQHGEFKQSPSNHLKGKGCPKCGKIKAGLNKKKFHNSVKFKDLIQPEEYKLIPLTKGKFAMVDNEDFDKVKDVNWCFENGYAYNGEKGRMHRYLMNTPDHLEVDHIIQENTLDNRRSNLRLATRAQNGANTRPHKTSTSKYKGVSWFNKRKKWVAQLYFEGTNRFLGHFNNEEEAARAHDIKALECWGEFAYLNFPELKEEYLKEIENLK